MIGKGQYSIYFEVFCIPYFLGSDCFFFFLVFSTWTQEVYFFACSIFSFCHVFSRIMLVFFIHPWLVIACFKGNIFFCNLLTPEGWMSIRAYRILTSIIGIIWSDTDMPIYVAMRTSSSQPGRLDLPLDLIKVAGHRYFLCLILRRRVDSGVRLSYAEVPSHFFIGISMRSLFSYYEVISLCCNMVC